MPMGYSSPGGTREVTFWIHSSRGTDEGATLNVPADWDDEDIKYELEEWCSQFPAWHVSENYVRYGWYDGKRDEEKEK